MRSMSTLLNKLAGFRDFTVLVVGDFMLDEFLYGDAERLSPDAPGWSSGATASADRQWFGQRGLVSHGTRRPGALLRRGRRRRGGTVAA